MESPGTTKADPGPVLVPELENRVPFLIHLEELRRRLLRALLWVGAGTALAFRFSEQILAWLLQPVGQVVFLTPAEPLLIVLKVAVFGGLILSSPLLAWEAWGFLAPALVPRERRAVFALVPLSFALFLGGVWFGWKLLLPAALKFLMSFGSDWMVPMLTVGHTIGFISWFVIACGIAFQIPVVMVFLASVGIVRPATLVRQWRVAALAILVGAAVLTPTPDVATQLLLAVPMSALYVLSIGLTALVAR